uniref:Hypothtetical protein, related n=1 Tax=Neospora caninum (strain Liverpool) TaxID=572307 RepID=A0A0F7U716_NEOCL|nr:TPA: Hypothtetical protein, related [Neospora caninum Liverpool]
MAEPATAVAACPDTANPPPLLPLRCMYTPGDRVADLDGHLGTVRYIGPVDGYSRRGASFSGGGASDSCSLSSSEDADLWIGVEWDEAERGKHDGSLNGKVYFTCVGALSRSKTATAGGTAASADGSSAGDPKEQKSKRCTAGSFVKRHKLLEPKDFKRAVMERYTRKLTQEQIDSMILVNHVTNKTKPVEFVGRKEAEEYFARLHLLNAMSFTSTSAIRTAGPPPRLVLPNLRLLSLANSLITDWQELLAILRCVPRLSSLSLCGTRLRASTLPPFVSRVSPEPAQGEKGDAHAERAEEWTILEELTELQLDQTFVTWDELLAFDSLAPHLQRLSIRGNDFSPALPLFDPRAGLPARRANAGVNGEESPAETARAFQNLVFLDVSDNPVHSWTPLVACMRHLPRLETICAVNANLGDFAGVQTPQTDEPEVCTPEKSPSRTGAPLQGGEESATDSERSRESAAQDGQRSGCELEIGARETRDGSAAWALSMRQDRRAKIIELCLEDNCIEKWETITSLARLFPSLERLMLQGNPLLLQPCSNSKAASVPTGFGASSPQRQVMISLFPSLKVLSGGTISRADRSAAERYTLSLLHRIKRQGEVSLPIPPGLVAALQSPNQAADRNSSAYEALLDRLTETHGDFSLGETAQGEGGAVVLASSLVDVLLQPDAAVIFDKPPVKKRVPKSMRVRDLKTLCMRLFGLPVAHIDLLYNDGNMPVSTPLDDDASSLDFFGVGAGSVVRVQDKNDKKSEV